MTLSEELAWRGFLNQTTYKDPSALDGDPITFYWGVDPSADSMTVGNLAVAMMVRHFIQTGHHKAVLLVGGATGLIGDPDGKREERDLKSFDEIAANKAKIAEQYQKLFAGQPFELVDNYDWFKGLGYLEFLRDVGKHVPMRQMLGREFVQSRLGEAGTGISYAEFSYSLIQAYDFLYLFREKAVTLQVCGADQWGNSIAGVELIRRITGNEAHVWSAPLVVNLATGVKFGKSEDGAVWLDPAKTTPTEFYQFWINCDDEGVESYLKIYTPLSQQDIAAVMSQHQANRQARLAQTRLAEEVTKLVHGETNMQLAKAVTEFLTNRKPIGQASEAELKQLRREIPHVQTQGGADLAEVLVQAGLVSSKSEGQRVRSSGGIYINGQGVTAEQLAEDHFQNGRLLLRRGKRFEDSALVELG